MSNPLRLIRKYQKRLMVFFGVLLMIAFIIGGALTTATNPNRDNADLKRTVVKWEGGKINRGKLNDHKYMHQLSQQFLFRLAQAAYEAESQPMVNVNLIQVPTDPQQGDQVMMQIICLAHQAEKMGVVVSDATIDTFLLLACDQELTEGEYYGILNELTGGNIDMVRIREALRRELLAYNMVVMANAGLSTRGQPFVTPVQAYGYDSRQFRSAQVELYALDVSETAETISEKPSNREIRELYEKGKTKFPDYTKQKPGFRVPPKLHMQWLKPDLEALKKLVGTIPESEIEAKYNEWKDDLDSPAWEIVQAPGTPENGENGAEDGARTTPEEGTETPNDSSETSGNDSDAASDADSTGPDSDSSVPDSDSSVPDSDSSVPDSGNPDGNSGGDADDSDQSNRDLKLSSQTQFVSVQEDSAQDDASASEQDEETSSDEAAKTGTQVEQEVKPPRPPASQPSADPPTGIGSENNAQDPTAGLAKPQLKPLERVRTEIIEELKEEKAKALGWDKIDEFRSEVLTPAYDNYLDYQFELEEDEDAEKPSGPNTEKWAKENGFQFDQTDGLVDFRAFADTSLGQFQVFDFQYFQATQSFPTVAMLLASQFDSLQPYAFELQPENQNRVQPDGSLARLPDFVYWPVESQENFVPELKDCEEEIIAFWRQQQALELTEKKAEEFAKKSNSKSSSLREVVSDASEVVITDPFTWMSPGGGNLAMGGGAPTLSEVRINRQLTEGSAQENFDVGLTINDLGPTFMESVFSLEASEAGVAVSENRETVYAVRVISVGGLTPSMLQDQVVKKTAVDPYVQGQAGGDQGVVIRDWLEELVDEMNVVWME